MVARNMLWVFFSGLDVLLFLSWCFFYSCLESSFLPLMEEKKQKKIKASGTPANLAGYLSNFLASVEAVRDVG